jgi:hypothetical protein
VATSTIGKMALEKAFMAKFSVTFVDVVAFGFQNYERYPQRRTFFCLQSNQEVFRLNQKEIQAAAIMMRIFLSGLALNFDADFHELEEITKRALLQVQTEAH